MQGTCGKKQPHHCLRRRCVYVERNVRVFKGKDKIVLLDVPLNIIKYRLRNDKTRPLLQKPDRDKVMKELYEKRLPIYKKAADITVSGKSSPMKTALAVIAAVEKENS